MPLGLAFNGDVRPLNIHLKKGGIIMSSQLREEFTNHLILQRYSPKTREAYVNSLVA